jgi:hypothetical protein
MPDVHASVPAAGQASHSAGFEAALNQALHDASGLGDPANYTVTVELWAVVKVTNPGQIQQYGVTLTPRA